jgi:hypothetical protein
MNAMPTSASDRSTPSASRSMATPRASSRSAEPQWLEAARFPCLATGTPAPATTTAETVEMLKVPLRSPPGAAGIDDRRGRDDRVGELEGGPREALELVGGLALRPERHQEAGDLTRRRVTAHDAAHRVGGLVGGEGLPGGEPREDLGPAVLAHDRPNASRRPPAATRRSLH